jgi:GrpB protein
MPSRLRGVDALRIAPIRIPTVLREPIQPPAPPPPALPPLALPVPLAPPPVVQFPRVVPLGAAPLLELGPQGAAAILHIRLHDSPFARHTVLLRDWLCTHPADRHRYQLLKIELSARHAHDGDYDDYTRGKSGLIAELADKIDDGTAAHG